MELSFRVECLQSRHENRVVEARIVELIIIIVEQLLQHRYARLRVFQEIPQTDQLAHHEQLVRINLQFQVALVGYSNYITTNFIYYLFMI